MWDKSKQVGHTINFPQTGGSWIILSDIEQRIKEKIEAVGMPLKDWDIKIYRGILTGCNEAFIINKNKRDELIKKCPKSAEIIRPILRGKDIKRYTYDFADKYLIATFPSRHYNIDDYPAVKNYLLNFGRDDEQYLDEYGSDCWSKKRLQQSGDQGSRKKTNNQWFETQDSIAYWDEFSKQKIAWGNLNTKAAFSIIPANIYINAPSPFITSDSLFILGFLNSVICDYCMQHLGVIRNGGYFEYKPMFIKELFIPRRQLVESCLYEQIEDLVEKNIKSHSLALELEIEDLILQLYGFTYDEIRYIRKYSEQEKYR